MSLQCAYGTLCECARACVLDMCFWWFLDSFFGWATWKDEGKVECVFLLVFFFGQPIRWCKFVGLLKRKKRVPVFSCLLLWQLFSANTGREDNIFHSFELSFQNRLSQLFDMPTYVTQVQVIQPKKFFFFSFTS